MRADVIEAMAECDAVCEQLHLPVQSGSTRILKAMRRTYSRERYLGLVERIREAMPGIALTTDIIVGFPGETEADFADTLSLVDVVGFDRAFTFVYSARRGTEAARMPDQVPEDVRRERIERLVDRIQHHAALRNSAARRHRPGGPRRRAEPHRPGDPARTDAGREGPQLHGHGGGGIARRRHGHRLDLADALGPPGRARRRLDPMAVIAIFGPTASGKSAVALELADMDRRRDRLVRRDAALPRRSRS